jgi:hypothetical protein
LAPEAPITLRMPISFVRCSAVKAARPKWPRQEMKMASERLAYYLGFLELLHNTRKREQKTYHPLASTSAMWSVWIGFWFF